MSIDVKEKVKQTACEKFVKFGYRRVTTDEIAKDAGISKRTLYEHFSSKEDIVKTMVIDEMNAMKRGLENICTDPEKNVIQKLTALFTLPRKISDRNNHDLFHDFKNEVPEVMEIVKKYENIFTRMVSALFIEGQEAGYLRKDIDPIIIFGFGKSIKERINIEDFPNHKGLTKQDIFKSFHKLFIQGALSKKALVEHFDEIETLLEMDENNSQV
jgi:AcrR family transcriptional regulator